MNPTLGPLSDGGRVVIIGGGPGGTACALALHRLAVEMGKEVQITILEGKQFTEGGHYNQCVGVLSPPLPSLMEEKLDLPFPYDLSRGEIAGYVLHTAHEQIRVAEEQQVSMALRRVQFDAYMLEAVRERGIKMIPARVVDLEFHADQVFVYTESISLDCDVVVGAFGMDEGSAALFGRQTGYQPPQALSSVVTKFHPHPDSMAAFGSDIHAFLPTHPQIEFGGVTPKGNHLTINIAGRAVNVNLMEDFLNLPNVQAALPDLAQAGKFDPHDFRYFKGRFPCSLARRYYGDRYVMIGDAAGLVRAFKGKGVTSAMLTGIRAAHTILQAGFSRKAFQGHYLPANRDITGDLLYGRGMRLMTILLSRFGLLDPVLRAARQDANLRTALFNAISAHAPYRQVILGAFHPRSILAILRALV